MGGGDLNMKKSWHTGTFQNKERVWKHEKSALEERKKLQELQKEREQERAVQELQRLQAEAGGKKRAERVDWMYAAPAEGNGPNAEELEAYLLGKKRVDKLLKGNEEMIMAAPSASAPGGSFTAIQNANTARDTAAKIREDPLLAIKRQEQLQYEKLLKNPQRLKELRERQLGSRTPAHRREEKRSKKDETKEERRARKNAKRAREPSDEDDHHRRPSRDEHQSGGRHNYDDGGMHERDRSRSPRRDPRRDGYSSHYDRDRTDYHDRSRGSYRDLVPQGSDRRPRERSPPAPSRDRDRDRDRHADGDRSSRPRESAFDHARQHHNADGSGRDLSISRDRQRPDEPLPREAVQAAKPSSAEDPEAKRKAVQDRLAAMQASAASLSASRAIRVKQEDEADRLEHEKEMEKRLHSGGVGPRFLREQEKKVFGGGMDLAERMRRSGKVGMVGDRDPA